MSTRFTSVFALLALCTFLSCAKKQDTGAADGASTGCTTPSGTPWTPSITGASASNHNDSTLVVTKYTEQTGSGNVLGQSQIYTLGDASTITFTFNVGTDLGTSGSISLVAKVTQMPAVLQGSAYPVLVSLTDPAANEYVNLNASCLSGGLASTACAPSAPSAYVGSSSTERKQQWMQHNFGVSAGGTVNVFPMCNWASGSPACDFNGQSWFSSGKLRTGTYTAKYILVGDSYSSIPAGNAGSMTLTTVTKKDNDAGTGRGAFDINVLLVGTKNVAASRTEKGQQNLNALFQMVQEHYNTQNPTTMAVKVGSVNVLEWGCSTGGDTYATVSTTDMGTLFKTGSALVPSSTEGKAVNVFLVSTLTGGSAGQTLLGLSGGLVGSPLNGMPSSGLVFATFDKLATFNPKCSGSSACTTANQEPAFQDMGSTVSHEIGHYLGLNHPSEATGTTHDALPLTPICTNISSGNTSTSIPSCLADTNVSPVTGLTCASQCVYGFNPADTTNPQTFCSAKVECQFNHIMWWTGKNYDYAGNGDGNLFTSDSGLKVGYHALVQ